MNDIFDSRSDEYESKINRAQSGPVGIIGFLATLFAILLILDVFFLGWFLVDEPIMKTLRDTLGSILPLLILSRDYR